MDGQSKHVVLGITGSIAAYKAADIIRCLKKKGHRVSVIMTQGAEEFITPLTLSTLSDEKVWRAMFGGEAQERTLNHLSLARDADVVVVAPATANVIGKIASGIADDLLTTVIMATRVPIIIAPAMNDQMWSNPIVQQNCEKLKTVGIKFAGPIEGSLACGVEGTGHIADIEDIIAEIEKVTISE